VLPGQRLFTSLLSWTAYKGIRQRALRPPYSLEAWAPSLAVFGDPLGSGLAEVIFAIYSLTVSFCIFRHMVSICRFDWNLKNMINNTYILPPKASLLPDMLHRMQSMHARQCKTCPLRIVKQANGPARLGTGPGDQPLACVFWEKSCKSGRVVPHLEHFPLALRHVRVCRTLQTGPYPARNTARFRVPASRCLARCSSRTNCAGAFPRTAQLLLP
jgi:hypothetical protein